MEVVEGVAELGDLRAFLDRLDEIADAHGCTVQAFDARYVVGPDHLRRAVELADRAIERGETVARERGVEILLYAAGRRQIDRALEMGVEEGELPVVVLVDEPSPSVRAALEAPPGGDDRAEAASEREGDADATGPGAGTTGSDAGTTGSDIETNESDVDATETDAGTTGSGAEAAAADAVAALLAPGATLGEYDPDRVRSFYDVGDAELAAVAGDLSDLVLERVALLDVEK